MGTIIDYTPAKSVNPYTQDVKDLAAAGEGKATLVTVAPETYTKNGESVTGVRVGVARRLIAEAARDAGYTARIREEQEQEDGSLNIVFTLGKLVTRRSPEQVAADKAAEEQDAKPSKK